MSEDATKMIHSFYIVRIASAKKCHKSKKWVVPLLGLPLLGFAAVDCSLAAVFLFAWMIASMQSTSAASVAVYLG